MTHTTHVRLLSLWRRRALPQWYRNGNFGSSENRRANGARPPPRARKLRVPDVGRCVGGIHAIFSAAPYRGSHDTFVSFICSTPAPFVFFWRATQQAFLRSGECEWLPPAVLPFKNIALPPHDADMSTHLGYMTSFHCILIALLLLYLQIVSIYCTGVSVRCHVINCETPPFAVQEYRYLQHQETIVEQPSSCDKHCGNCTRAV